MDVTNEGFSCANWNDESVHEHKWFKDETHNFCRSEKVKKDLIKGSFVSELSLNLHHVDLEKRGECSMVTRERHESHISP